MYKNPFESTLSSRCCIINKIINMTNYYKPVNFILKNNRAIPQIGFGTWQASDEDTYNSVLLAIESGYRHIDTAYIYKNEEAVGRAIKDSLIPREEIFLTTKLWNTFHTNPRAGLEKRLRNLGVDYIDLYLMHHPVALNPDYGVDRPRNADGTYDVLKEWTFVKTYHLCQEFLANGKIKALGVCNFTLKNLKILLNDPATKYIPDVVQNEIHPLLPQHELLKFCSSLDIVMEAFSPLGSTNSPLFHLKEIVEMAEKYKVTSAQILLSWGVWRRTVILPKSVTGSRIKMNFEGLVVLEDEDGNKLDLLTEKYGTKRFVDPQYTADVYKED